MRHPMRHSEIGMILAPFAPQAASVLAIIGDPAKLTAPPAQSQGWEGLAIGWQPIARWVIEGLLSDPALAHEQPCAEHDCNDRRRFWDWSEVQRVVHSDEVACS